MGRDMIRVGLAGAHRNKGAHDNRVKRNSCSTTFIQQPSNGQTVDVANSVAFVWDPSCLNITGADIYLYAPLEATPLIQMFQNVDFVKGSFNATLKPKWWNSTSSVNLQLKMVETGKPIFQATLPPGPMWTANYNASEASTDASSSDDGTMTSSDSGITQVNNLETGKGNGGLSKGAIVAAVLVPLIVIGLAIGVYVKLIRAREAKARRRWSEKMDQRMSVISVDWRAMSTKGAEAVIRASMADPIRASMWSGIGPATQRPSRSSTFAVEGNISSMASSAFDGNSGESESDSTQMPMTQIRRPGVGLRGFDSSRVSFAADTRFSKASSGGGAGADTRGRPSTDSPRRPLHAAHAPPVPSRLSEFVQEEGDSSVDKNALAYVPAHSHSQPSIDEMMPALNMMRAMNASESDASLTQLTQKRTPAPLHLQNATTSTTTATATTAGEYELEYTPAPTAPSAAALKSPIVGSAMPMHPMHAIGADATAALTPDAMLRAYAEQRKGSTGSGSGGGRGAGLTSPPPPGGVSPAMISYPMPVVVSGSGAGAMGGMRSLYSPPAAEGVMRFPMSGSAGSVHSSHSAGSVASNNPFRQSISAKGAMDKDYNFDAHAR